jgi:hypothetical protein
MTASHWNPAKYPLPQQKELQIHYDPDTDILTLGNGTPASNGWDVAEDLMVFVDDEDEPHIVTLEGAAKLLRPYLFPEVQSAGVKVEDTVQRV